MAAGARDAEEDRFYDDDGHGREIYSFRVRRLPGSGDFLADDPRDMCVVRVLRKQRVWPCGSDVCGVRGRCPRRVLHTVPSYVRGAAGAGDIPLHGPFGAERSRFVCRCRCGTESRRGECTVYTPYKYDDGYSCCWRSVFYRLFSSLEVPYLLKLYFVGSFTFSDAKSKTFAALRALARRARSRLGCRLSVDGLEPSHSAQWALSLSLTAPSTSVEVRLEAGASDAIPVLRVASDLCRLARAW